MLRAAKKNPSGMLPWLKTDTLDQSTLQAAVSSLAADLLQQQYELATPRGCWCIWDPSLFLRALGAAAKGDTRALQACWFADPQVKIHRSNTTACMQLCWGYWQTLLTALVSAGHVDVLEAFLRAHPNRFILLINTLDFLAAAIEAGPGSPSMEWLQGLSSWYIDLPHVSIAAAKAGRLDVLQWLQRPLRPDRFETKLRSSEWDPVRCAQLVSTSHAWQQLRSSPASSVHHMYGSSALCTLAAALGDTAMLVKLRSAVPACPFDAETAAILAGAGRTADLERLLQSVPSSAVAAELVGVVLFAALAATQHDQLTTLSWIWEHYSPSAKQPPLALSRLYDADAVVQDLSDRAGRCAESKGFRFEPCKTAAGACWSIIVTRAALQRCKMDVLEWMWDRCPQAFWQQQACDYVVTLNPASLQWLLARYPPCSWEPNHVNGLGTLLDATSHHMHLPSPGLLHEIRLIADQLDFCTCAAEAGNLELLKYLQALSRTQYSHRQMLLAASNGHLRTLQWMVSECGPCQLNIDISNAAAVLPKADVLQWLLEHQPTCPPPSWPEEASAPCLALLVQWDFRLNAPAQAKAKALGPLSPSLVIGLARWQRKFKSMGQEARQIHAARLSGPQGLQLLSHFASLPDQLTMHICVLAGMCRPLPDRLHLLS